MKRKYVIILCLVIIAVFCGIISGGDIQSQTADSSGKRTFELPI